MADNNYYWQLIIITRLMAYVELFSRASQLESFQIYTSVVVPENNMNTGRCPSLFNHGCPIHGRNVCILKVVNNCITFQPRILLK